MSLFRLGTHDDPHAGEEEKPARPEFDSAGLCCVCPWHGKKTGRVVIYGDIMGANHPTVAWKSVVKLMDYPPVNILDIVHNITYRNKSLKIKSNLIVWIVITHNEPKGKNSSLWFSGFRTCELPRGQSTVPVINHHLGMIFVPLWEPHINQKQETLPLPSDQQGHFLAMLPHCAVFAWYRQLWCLYLLGGYHWSIRFWLLEGYPLN